MITLLSSNHLIFYHLYITLFVNNLLFISEFAHCRQTGNMREYLVKWKELGYEDVTWELEEDIAMFDCQIDRFNKLKAKRASNPKKRKGLGNDREVQKKRKEFKAFEETPKCLVGGILRQSLVSNICIRSMLSVL